MLQKFLDGKKKYSAFIITILATLLPLFVQDPAAQNELSELIPPLAAVISGIVYIIIQGNIDKEKAKTASNGAVAVVTTTSSANVTNPSKEAESPQNPSPGEPEVYEPFDPKAADEQVEQRAKSSYLEATDMTRFFAAQDYGAATKCSHIDQALGYWDWLLVKAHKAFEAKFGYPYAQAEKHLNDNKDCPYYSVDNMARQMGIDFWRMLLDLRRIAQCNENLSSLAASGMDWKARLDSPQRTLYNLGAMAGTLLGSK